MVKLRESLTKTEKELKQKEAELSAIRASEDREERDNAIRVQELRVQVAELEDAVKARNEDVARQSEEANSAAATAAEKDHELLTLKATLSSCQAELAECLTRANAAEVTRRMRDSM